MRRRFPGHEASQTLDRRQLERELQFVDPRLDMASCIFHEILRYRPNHPAVCRTKRINLTRSRRLPGSAARATSIDSSFQH